MEVDNRLHVEFSNVTKIYSDPPRSVTALNDISFQINEGEFVCIVGPSGCGKSTLLRMIAGLDRPSSGEIRFKGDLLTAPHPKISMVFQTFALLPWRTVLENVAFGLEVQNVPKRERENTARELLGMVGLKDSENLFPKQLSGGMKQRVGIARALAIDPEVVLMDEAFSAIDEFTAEALREELADRILVLSARPARVKSIVPIELVRPRSPTASDFVSIHKDIFSLLQAELEASIMRRRLGEIKEFQKLRDMEDR